MTYILLKPQTLDDLTKSPASQSMHKIEKSWIYYNRHCDWSWITPVLQKHSPHSQLYLSYLQSLRVLWKANTLLKADQNSQHAFCMQCCYRKVSVTNAFNWDTCGKLDKVNPNQLLPQWEFTWNQHKEKESVVHFKGESADIEKVDDSELHVILLTWQTEKM